MRKFKFNSTQATLETIGGSGVVEAVYSGPFTRVAFVSLRDEVLQSSGHARSVVLRMDRTLDLMPEMPPTCKVAYSVNNIPGAVIVRRDQFYLWSAYAKKLAEMGVMRSVWLEEHAQMAYQWALHQSVARLQELQQ